MLLPVGETAVPSNPEYERGCMAGYIVVQVDVKDAERYEAYRQLVQPTLAAYGGRFLVRGGRVENLEGDWHPARFVVLEFDSVERAKAWWSSAEYAEAKALRQETTRTEMIVVEGIDRTS